MDLRETIKNLQNKPYETRVKILWLTIGIVAVILVAIWVFSLKSTIQGLNGKNLIKADQTTKSNSAKTDTAFVSVERVEQTGNSFKIYFNVNNSTDDILNFPDLTNITLEVNGQSLNPTQIFDRQNNPFVKKILSHTQNFGTLVYPTVNATSGKLTIDQMSFEKTTDQIFQQELNLNFTELKKSSNLRN